MIFSLRGTVVSLSGLCLALAPVALAPVSLAAQSAPSTFVPTDLTVAQVTADVALVRQSLEQVHAGYDRYVPRRVMDSAFAGLGRRAETPMTDVQLYRELALLLAKVRCNHTKAELPPALERYRRTAATHLPFHVRVFEKRLFVNVSATPLAARGEEIVSINGNSAADVITKLSRFAAVDGFTDFSRAALLERDGDLMGSDLDHYWPIEFGFPERWTIKLRRASGVSHTETLPSITFDAWNALTGDTKQLDFANGTRWSMLNDTTAQLTLRSFVNYRTPINADSLYKSIFSQLRARGARHLIIDLRENGGGSDDASAGLIRYLADRPVTPLLRVRRRTILIDSTLSAAFDTWGDRAPIFTPSPSLFEARADGWFLAKDAITTFAPAAEAFRGRVSVLVGRGNSSGSTMLLAVLQAMGSRTGRLRLVGEETGGSAEGPTAGQILFLRLPSSGIRVRIPLQRSDVNAVQPVFGMGLFPDLDASQTIADFRAGIDRAAVVARTAPWRPIRSPLAPTVGLMRGELEYRNYADGTQVILPTSVHTSPIGTTGAFRIRTIYDDGPGNTIYSTDEVRVRGDRWIEGAGAAEGKTSAAQAIFRIVSRKTTPEGQVLVFTGRGIDDDKPVIFRYTVTLGADVSTRLKEFRLPGKAWEYRHEYRFRRVGRSK